MSLVARYKLDESSGLVAVDEVAAANAAADPDNVAVSISDCVDDGFGLISVTTSTHHNLATGDTVDIAGVSGTTEANGTWTVTKTSHTTFTLDGSTFANAYTGGGTADRTSAFPWSWSGTAASVPSGSTGSLSIGNNSHFDTPNILAATKASAFSVACWVQRASTAGSRSAAVGARVVANSFEFCLGTGYTTPTKFSCDVGKAYVIHQPCEATSTYSLNTWYHLCAVTRNNGGNWEVELYVNGVSQNVTVYAGDVLTANDSDGTWSIGSEPDDTAQNDYSFGWDGLIDEVRIYNHTLSLAEVQALAGIGSPAPLVSLTSSTASIAENGGAVSIIATMDATASATVDVVVGFTGAASTGSDYTLSTTTISIASGQTSGSLTATAINDSVYEGDEAFTASITSVTGGGASASSTASTSVVTIVDDESAPVVTLSGPTNITASEDSGITSVFTLTLNNASYQDVTVNLNYSGSATNTTDYTRSGTSVVISAGQTSGSFSVTRLSDTLYEGAESVIVGLGSITNGSAASGASSGSATITDSDSAPTVNLSSSTTSIVENVATAYVVARLDIASAFATTIDFGFSGSATLNTDYSASSNSIIITAGQTSGSISVTSIQDSSYEGNETIIVGITSVTNGSAGATNSLSITLVDDDSAPLASPTVSLSASQTSIDENGGSAIIRALLSATHSATVTVTLGIGGTATNTVDYTRTTDAISIASGQTSGSIGITSIQDTIGEGNETVVFSIASVTSGVSASTDSVTVTIVDEGVVTNEVGMESTNRPRIAPNAPLIDAVVSCGVVTDWIDICTAPETADNGGSTVVDPGSITRTDQKWKALCSLGTQLLVRLKYDAGVTSPTSPAVQLFGMDANGTINQLVDGSGTHTQTLTIDLTNDVTDGTFKYTTAKTLNIAGCKDVLAAIKTAFAGTGTVNNSTIQARVI